MKKLLHSDKFRTLVASLLLITIVFVSFSNLNSFKYLFSSSFSHRLQTEALLKGKLLISDRINDSFQDHALGDYGWQQMWGLGVPLLRLPFEIIAKIFGYKAFPDSIVYFLFLFLSAYCLTTSLYDFYLDKFTRKTSFQLTLFSALFLCLNSGISLLWVYPFGVYEEAVSYSLILAAIEFSLLLKLSIKPKIIHWYLLCLLVAFHPFIRLTGVFYGIAAIIIAIFLIFKVSGYRCLLKGLSFPICAIVILFLLNFYRFGDFWEFGFNLTISAQPELDYMIRFKNTFLNESLYAAVKEELALIFFNPEVKRQLFYEQLHSWQAATIRFRDIYFNVFTYFDFFMLLLSLTCLLFSRNLDKFKFLLIFSVLSFSLFFGFYLYTPAITSRYIAEFSLAIQVNNVILLAYFLKNYITYQNLIKKCILVLCLVQLINSTYTWKKASEFSVNNLQTIRLDYQVVSTLIFHLSNRRYLNLEPEYICGKQTTEIYNNKLAWDQKKCTVAATTFVFLPESKCIELKVIATNEYLKELRDIIRVKSNQHDLELQHFQIVAGTAKYTYCSKHPAASIGYRQVSISWLKPEELFQGAPRLRLQHIKVSDFKDNRD